MRQMRKVFFAVVGVLYQQRTDTDSLPMKNTGNGAEHRQQRNKCWYAMTHASRSVTEPNILKERIVSFLQNINKNVVHWVLNHC